MPDKKPVIEAGLSRQEQIDGVLVDAAWRRLGGESLPDQVLISRHADLLPELGEALEDLCKVERARVAANDPEPSNDEVYSEVGKDGASQPFFIPPRIGPYRVLELIGTGGMGVVYLAEQENPRRKVALKVVRSDISTPQRLRRFEFEAQLLGRLQHPAITRVFEAGSTDTEIGLQPFLAMEYIKGRPLLAFSNEAKLDMRQRLELLAKVCDGVQHAHQNGVIHRDLKPDNVLVDETGQPKILDFGLARATDSDVQATTRQTEIGQLLGTIPYMSPEQLSGNPQEIDTRSDVHALGAIGYELLTGELPFKVRGVKIPEAARMIQQDEPESLSSHDRELRGDVETIIGKALEKSKDRRYQSAGDLAADLRRFLLDEPIAARPPTAWYQMRKFARRNRALVTGLALAFVGLSVGFVVALTQARRAALESEYGSFFGYQLDGMFRSVTPSVAKGRDTTILREILDQAVNDIHERRLADIPHAEFRFRITIGNALNQVGEYETAEDLLRGAVEMVRTEVGENNAGYATAINSLAYVLKIKGEYKEAERLSRQALDIRKRLLGEEDLGTAESMHILAVVLQKQGNRGASEGLLTQALEVRRKLLGDKHKDVASVLGELGNALAERGKLEQAERYHREAMAVYSETDGPESIEVARCLNNLARVMEKRKEYSEAEALLRKSLAMRRKLLGDKHSDIGTALNSLANVLESAGNLEEAEKLYEEALELRRKTLGEEHDKTTGTMENLVALRRKKADPAKTERSLRELLAQNRKRLGDDHPEVARTLHNLAATLEAKGSLDESETLYRQALEIRRRKLGFDHPDVARNLVSLANVLERKMDFQSAEEAFREALSIRQRLLEQDPSDVATTMYNLARVLERGGRHDEAENWVRQRITLCEGHFPRMDRLHWLGSHVLGRIMGGRGQFIQGEALLLESYEKLKDALDDTYYRKRDVIEATIRFYESWNVAEPGKGHEEKAAPFRMILAQEVTSTRGNS
ncbi:MAG: serine/threonine-protein kinase [Planctomycetota bacterium]